MIKTFIYPYTPHFLIASRGTFAAIVTGSFKPDTLGDSRSHWKFAVESDLPLIWGKDVPEGQVWIVHTPVQGTPIILGVAMEAKAKRNLH